ncbi:arsenate reductase (glutaredoxin) [Aliidiomarina taiwanensis]|uniref:Arsenate reductase n=1 Tax=Aliidiomarina taiwanensis TaxID=946228 RepID=A0A432XAH1_9GAMM|nr:arsenate reductase (glutaredoxin) [Aliidiomarina taiwanensis]RUO44324.1 arsenate reductase (glutaredoxin) [Aliidiomarina taiwanensis]
MSSIVMYHNPRCSKSRQTLALLQEQGIEPTIVEYLKTPPSSEELSQVLAALGISAREIIRTGEEEYKTLNLATFDGTEAELIALLCDHPKLIQRPIVINGDKAKIGRPPEDVLQIV